MKRKRMDRIAAEMPYRFLIGEKLLVAEPPQTSMVFGYYAYPRSHYTSESREKTFAHTRAATRWCHVNFGPCAFYKVETHERGERKIDYPKQARWYVIYDHTGVARFGFKNEDDAVLFKTFWG